MTSNLIVQQLSKEFSVSDEQVRSTLEMIDAGLAAPFIGRVRRAETGGFSEGHVRRLERLRTEYEELDRRRGTILRLLEGPEPKEGEGEGESSTAPALLQGGPIVAQVDPGVIERVKACMDRFELEDLFLPHRRPEPEVQLALDRGLKALADRLVAPVPPEERKEEPAAAPEAPPKETAEVSEETADEAPAETTETPAPADAPKVTEASEPADGDSGGAAPAPEEASVEQPVAVEKPPTESAAQAQAEEDAAIEALLHGQIELTPGLARICSEFVSPDRGLHTESDVLAGAMRILSDRLGRDTRLRGQIRRMLRKQGILSVRPLLDESRLGRHKPLMKLRQPLRQIQGHRLLAIRQAQKERALATVLTLDRKQALPRVRAALGKHTNPEYAGVLDAIAMRTLEHRLIPLLEADVRLELKERADEEALRFLSQHLRQVLLTPPLGARPVAGVDVNAKGDWTLAVLDARGNPVGEVVRIDTAGKEPAALGAELAAVVGAEGREAPVALAVGHGKGPRAGQKAMRNALAAAGKDVFVHIVNEAGLSSYASSELARRELPDHTVPQRMAISLGRRLQDPMNEILKVDPRHLGLGAEQGLVSKANLKRMFAETVESCTAHVGCDVNQAPLSYLMHVPGLDAGTAGKLVERRAERRFESREELRTTGILTEAQWTTAASFLRVHGSSERLDATTLHPEQYDLARRVVESGGGTIEDSVGRPGITKGLRRTDFDVEEHTWRDLMRELWHPGRDPRPGLFRAALLDPAADPVTLSKGRPVEGVVTNVASFGAFVDIGLLQDAMVHVSEISRRYVRDARELVSIGQSVRASIKEARGQRLSLSIKDAPEPAREGRRDRHDRKGRGAPRERHQQPSVPVRAAQSRRDGLASSGERGRGKGRGKGRDGGRPSGRGPGRGPGRGDRRRRDEEFVHPEDLKSVAGEAAGYNPFANFFKEKEPEKGGTSEPGEPESEAQETV